MHPLGYMCEDATRGVQAPRASVGKAGKSYYAGAGRAGIQVSERGAEFETTIADQHER